MVSKNEVMLVDDEEGVRVSWQRFLSEQGLKVTTAADGASAISHLTRHPVNVVVSDLRMPGTDGLAVLEWLRARQPDTRFILFTGYGNEQVAQRAQQLGAYQYLEKPIAPQVLADTITAALRAAPSPIPERPPAPDLKPTPSVPETPRPAGEPESAAQTVESTLAMVGTLVAAPIFGLAYVIFLPVIGFGILGWMIAKRIRRALGPKPA